MLINRCATQRSLNVKNCRETQIITLVVGTHKCVLELHRRKGGIEIAAKKPNESAHISRKNVTPRTWMASASALLHKHTHTYTHVNLPTHTRGCRWIFIGICWALVTPRQHGVRYRTRQYGARPRRLTPSCLRTSGTRIPALLDTRGGLFNLYTGSLLKLMHASGVSL
jgi:hypothetical protein